MQFDYIVGNPPYQTIPRGNQTFYQACYHKFLDLGYRHSSKVCMIHPARYLSRAGSTPTDWMNRMLNDPYIQILSHNLNSNTFFPNIEITGGIAITLRNIHQRNSITEVYTTIPELESIRNKIIQSGITESLCNIIGFGIKLNKPAIIQDFPALEAKIKVNDIRSNGFELMPELFHTDLPQEVVGIRVRGRSNSKRIWYWIPRKYVHNDPCLDAWKIIIPNNNGSPPINANNSTPVIGLPEILQPGETTTRIFNVIGPFKNPTEAEHAFKYICSRFARALLSILKVTASTFPSKWIWVPMQDFTNNSDINWHSDVDQQLYSKYHLSSTEQQFLNTHISPL